MRVIQTPMFKRNAKPIFTALFLSIMLSLLNISPVYMQGNCNTLPTRLTVGGSGRVAFTDGNPLNVRAQADRSSTVAAMLPEGTTFDVLEGSVCSGDIN